MLCSPVYISYLATMGVMVVAMLLVYRRGSQKLAYAPHSHTACPGNVEDSNTLRWSGWLLPQV